MPWLALNLSQDLFTASSRSNVAEYSPRQDSFAEQLYLTIKIAKTNLGKENCFDKTKQCVIRGKIRHYFQDVWLWHLRRTHGPRARSWCY
jgi:hypothetical protein